METFSALVAICAGNSSVNSPHKGHWRGALMFSLITRKKAQQHHIHISWDILCKLNFRLETVFCPRVRVCVCVERGWGVAPRFRQATKNTTKIRCERVELNNYLLSQSGEKNPSPMYFAQISRTECAPNSWHSGICLKDGFRVTSESILYVNILWTSMEIGGWEQFQEGMIGWQRDKEPCSHLNIIKLWVSNYIHRKHWDAIPHLYPSFNRCWSLCMDW